jgi:hypothetical protein
MRAWVLAATLAVAGCTASRPPPPRAPALVAAVDALPPDLDLVVRVDLAKVRAALGPHGMELIRRGTGTLPDDATAALVASAFERTTTAYLALRPELVPGDPDNVLVLEGHFNGLEIDRTLVSSGWSSPVDLGGDVRRFDRKTRVGRSAPARLYVFRDEELVFVSTAEIDSVEAVLEHSHPASRLHPREQGVVAFAARARAFRYGLDRRFPSLARAVGDTRGVEGLVDASPEGLSVEISFELPDETLAEQSAGALAEVGRTLAGTSGTLGKIAETARTEAVGRYVVVRLAVNRGLL